MRQAEGKTPERGNTLQKFTRARREHQSAERPDAPILPPRLKKSMQILTELAKHLNTGAFLAGLISGIALSIAMYTIGAFISRHWKSTLILCAVITTAALVMLAI